MDTGSERLDPPSSKMEEVYADDTAVLSSENTATTEGQAGKQPKNSRKRTKTGCLTCRKRRIKCGEERPRCNNCVKSKRNCEGYNQRVIFKDPIHGYRSQVPPAAITIPSFQRPTTSAEAQATPRNNPQAGGSSQLPLIAPRPYNTQQSPEHRPPDTQGQPAPGYHAVSVPGDLSLNVQPAVSGQDMFSRESGATRLESNPSHQLYTRVLQGANHPYGTDSQSNIFNRQPVTSPSDSLQHDNQERGSDLKLLDPYSREIGFTDSGSRSDIFLQDNQSWISRTWQEPQMVADKGSRDQITPEDEERSDDLYDVQDEEMEDEPPEVAPEYSMLADGDIANRLGPLLPLHPRFDDSSMRTFRTLLNEPNMLATYQPSPSASPLTDPRTARIFAHFVSATGPSLSIFERHPTNPSVMFTEGPVPKARQNLWTYTIPMLALTHPALMHAILAISSLHIAKLQGGSPVSSLKHYHVSIMRLKKSVGLPSSRSGIGTLAATLLLGFYEVIAGEHSKWNSHLLGAKQLLQEIDFAGMTEQLKFMKAQEDAFAHGGTYSAFPTSLVYSYVEHKPYKQYLEVESVVDEHLISKLTGRSMPNGHQGRSVGEAIGVKFADGRQRALTTKELEDFQLRSDLFWWFCKQDVFQSILSGNRLLMEYRRRGECLPRAAIGRLDAVYGTADHLWLLLGRLADFNARDQRRKKRAVDANGGQWKPPPPTGTSPQSGVSYSNAGKYGQRAGMGPATVIRRGHHAGMNDDKWNSLRAQHLGEINSDRTARGNVGSHHGMGLPSPAPTSRAAASGITGRPPGDGQRFSGPPDPLNGMHGMIPPTPAAKMPEGFVNGPFSPANSEDDDLDLEAATIEAVKEWEDIKQALSVFEDSLGPDYKCLSSEYQQTLATPFGPALYYRTYSIACIWGFYYTALILHHRTHPSMPPAAMMAAGVAAQQTAGYANEIGRICAGLIPTNHTGQVSPALGGAIAECVIPLFFAGVQYQDAGQRVYTVSKLREITRMTGWQSAAAVAAGCESAWVRQGELGRGPPYVRTRDLWAKDERVSGHRRGPHDPVVDSNSDRRFIQVNPTARVHWAIGIIGVEEDMENLSV